MKQYKMLETSKADAEKLMNEMAKEGWEVVSVTFWNFWGVCLLITFSKDV